MAWSSFTSISRQLALSMKARTPKTAFLKFRQYKRLLHEEKSPPPITGKVPSVTELQKKIMAVVQPWAQNITKFVRSNANVGAVIVLVPTSIIGSFYLWRNHKHAEDEVTDKKNPVANSITVLMSSQRDGDDKLPDVPDQCSQKIPDPDKIPCVSCAVPCPDVKETGINQHYDAGPLSVVEATLLTSNTPGNSPPSAVKIQKDMEDSGLMIPVMVNQDNAKQKLSAATTQNIISSVNDEDDNDVEESADGDGTQTSSARHGHQ